MGFMNTDIVNGRRNERKRCNEAAMRTKRPLRVGYINAIRYWGVPVPKTDLASNRVHVSVPRAQDRNHIAGVTFHVFSGKEEYCKYEYERFWMASPAMAWAQMATYCDTEALATIASAFASREERRKKARKDDFAAYLDASPRFAGKRKCEEALPYIVEDTDSPPETPLFGILLDSGLGRPYANYRVRLRHGTRLIDMAYPDCKVGFEYQGATSCEPPEQMRKDAARFNELQHNGWTIIMVTADDLRTEEIKAGLHRDGQGHRQPAALFALLARSERFSIRKVRVRLPAKRT